MVEGVQQGPVLVGTFFTTLSNANTGLRRQGEHSSLALNSCHAC